MKSSHIFLLFLIAAAVMYIVSTSENYSSYAGFDKASKNEGTVFQLVGVLNKDKDIYFEPEKNANYFSFFLVDKEGREEKVVYHGPPPPDFERSEDVVLNGKMVNNEFVASKILLKCPSKYEDGKFEQKEYEVKEYASDKA